MTNSAISLIQQNIRVFNENGSARHLDLSNCALTELPEELLTCKWLQSLNLGTVYTEDDRKYNGRFTDSIKERNILTSDGISRINELTELKVLLLNTNKLSDLTVLSELKKLEVLFLRYNEIEDLTALQYLHGLNTLFLDYNRIYNLEPLGKLPNLTTLSVEGNNLVDLKHLVNFHSIKSLNLNRNKPDLDTLRPINSLERLSLQFAEISDISALGKLQSLRSLNLSGNSISDISAMSKLKRLEQLDISNNKIEDISPLSRLTFLNELDLRSNVIAKIMPLAGLKGLKDLELGINKVKDISPLHTMVKLNYLALGYNEISNIEILRELKQLRSLDLSGNKIDDLTPLSNLESLEYLFLDGNLIEDPSPLSGLEKLVVLQLNNNRISNIEKLKPLISLLENDALQLMIDKNPFLESSLLTLDQKSNNRESVINFLFKTNEGGASISLPVKVLLLGNHQSGKSSLLDYILADSLETKPLGSTHLLRIETYPKGAPMPEAIFFDFGGQDYYHGIYRAFISQDSIQILLWNIKNNNNELRDKDSRLLAIRNYNLDYWFGQKHYVEQEKYDDQTDPLLLIQSHLDIDPRMPLSTHSKTSATKIHSEHFLCLVKDEDYLGISKAELDEREAARLYFKTCLFQIIDKTQRNSEQPQWYVDFTMYIFSQKNKSNPHLPISLTQVAKNYKSSRHQYLSDDLDQLHKRGLILYYKNEIPNKVWVNPEALVKHIQSEILSESNLKSYKGRVPSKHFLKFNRDIIHLLLLQKVIFLNRDNRRGDEYIIPNYLPLASEYEHYKLFSFSLKIPVVILKFERFIPFGLINQMICFYGSISSYSRFWRDQILFTFNDKLILIQLDFDVLEIKINANDKLVSTEIEYLFYSVMALYWDSEPLDYQSIQDNKQTPIELDKITDSALNYKWDMWVRLYERPACRPADLFISVDDKYFVRYADLCESEPGSRTIKASLKSDISFNANTSKDVAISIYQPFTNKQFKTVKKIFISYSHDDISVKETIQTFLVNLEREKLVEIWHDGMIRPGDLWDDKIKESIEEADIILLLVSQSFINSAYIHEVEMSKAIRKAIEKSAIIIPILIKNCDWAEWKIIPEGTTAERLSENRGRLGRFQFMPMDKHKRLVPLVKWEHQEDAFFDLVKEIRRIVSA